VPARSCAVELDDEALGRDHAKGVFDNDGYFVLLTAEEVDASAKKSVNYTPPGF